MSEVIRLNRALDRLIAKEKTILAQIADGGDTFRNEARLEEVQFQRREALASAAEAEYEASKKKEDTKGKTKTKYKSRTRGAGGGGIHEIGKGAMRRAAAKTFGKKLM